MRRDFRRKWLSSFLRSRALTVCLLVLAVAISLAVGREVAREISVHQEVNRLSAEISRAEQSSNQLSQLIATLQSPTFQERTARTKLNLQKPGEKVLIIPDLNNANRAATRQPDARSEAPITPAANTHRWWNFLFSPKS